MVENAFGMEKANATVRECLAVLGNHYERLVSMRA